MDWDRLFLDRRFFEAEPRDRPHRSHFQIDQGKDLNKAEKRELTLTAICRTYQKLWDQNLIEVRK